MGSEKWDLFKANYINVKIRFNKDSEIEKHIQEVLKKEKVSSYINRLVEEDMKNAENH